MVRCPLCWSEKVVRKGNDWYECKRCNIEFNAVTQIVVDLDKKKIRED